MLFVYNYDIETLYNTSFGNFRAQIAAALYDGTAERAVVLPSYFDRRLYDLIESYATLS